MIRVGRPRTVLNAVYFQICTGPGRTEMELTRTMYGPDRVVTKIAVQVRQLLKDGRVYRKGEGNRRDPFRYYPVQEEHT